MTNIATEFPVGSWERPDAGGIVRRGEAVSEHFTGYVEHFGETPHCHVGHHFNCERPAVMEVYGLYFCEVHGEQAAHNAMEELYFDLERRIAPDDSDLSPHVEYAFRQTMKSIPDPDTETFDAALVEAFPFDEKAQEQVLDGTGPYFQIPKDERFGFSPPYDTHRYDSVIVCKYIRLAFEERQTWLVEMLEKERESLAAQAAWALAVEDEIEPR